MIIELRRAGFTDVTINNASGYDIFIERIDVTKNKEGKIQITDTSTGVGSAGDPFERTEYTFSEGEVREQRYHGVLSAPNADGLVIVNYVAVGQCVANICVVFDYAG